MKITFINPNSKVNGFGGASVHFQQVARQLRRLGHEIAVFSKNRPIDSYRWFPDIPLGAWKAARWSDVFYQRFRSTAMNPGSLSRSLRLVRKICRVPLVWEINAPISELAILRDVDDHELSQHEERGRRNAAHVSAAFCVSREVQTFAEEVLNLEHTYHVPNGGDCDHFGPHVEPIEDLSCSDGIPNLLWMGNGKLPWEGDRIFVELGRRLHDAGIACNLALCGRRRPGLPPLSPNVRHFGKIDHAVLPQYVAAADICLALYDLSAYGEHGFYNSPVKLHEYMAAGKAIVATRAGEIARTIEHGHDGLLVGTEMDDIVAAIKTLLKNSSLRESLGRAARQKAVEFYNWERAARQTADVLCQL